MNDSLEGSVSLKLHRDMELRRQIHLLIETEKEARSRFRFGSPCRLIRTLDILVHIVLPELIDDFLPTYAAFLRSTSPRWGRSWRSW